MYVALGLVGKSDINVTGANEIPIHPPVSQSAISSLQNRVVSPIGFLHHQETPRRGRI